MRRLLSATSAAATREALVAFLISRAALTMFALWAVLTFALTSGSGPWQEWSHSVSQPWLAIFSRWDGRWYFYVAHDGYSFDPARESNVNVAPLLPALMWLGGHIMGRTDTEGLLAVGFALANLALVVALVYLGILVRQTWSGAVAVRTLICLVAFPTSFFLSAVYSESVFLAPVIAAFVYAGRRQWWPASIAGALAALSRTYGVLIIIPLAYEYLNQSRRECQSEHRWAVRQDAAPLILIPAAFGGWLLYLWRATGDPLSMALEQAHRGRTLLPPWDVAGHFLSQPLEWTLDSNHSAVDLGFAVGFGVLVLLSWLLRRRSLGLFATLLFVPMISSGMYASVSRFGLELFPAFIVLGHVTRWRSVLALYLTLAGSLSLYLMARFALGYWVA